MQRPRIVQASLQRKNKFGGLKVPDFKIYDEATVKWTMWHWHKDEQTDQYNRTESPEINPFVYGHFFFLNKGNAIMF